MITLRQNPNEPTLYIGSERGGGKLPSFAPESSPRLVATTPADESGAVSTTPTIRLTFDTPVTLGSGSFFISDGTTQSYVNGAGQPDVRIVGATHTLQVPAGSAQLGSGGFYVEFTPPSTLKSGTAYFVYFKPGAVVSAGNGLPFAGLSDATGLNFTTTSDFTAPTALSAKTSNPAGTYKAGDVISITVNFSETVNVIGTPRLELNLGASRFATLSGASSGTSLTFSYTVQAGDTATELGFIDLIDLASGIVDGNGNALGVGNIAFVNLDGAASTGQGSDLVIDTTAPTALSWNVTEGATDVAYGSTLSLSFSEPVVAAPGAKLFVDVNGVPTEVLLTDPSISIAGNTLFLSNLASNTQYSVTLSAGAVTDVGGTLLAGSASTSFATAATSPANDTIAPKVLDISATVGATTTEYNLGGTISILVTMSENVTVTGTPKLQLQLDGKVVEASYASSSGKVLTFSYTVQPGDNVASLAYAGTGALVLPGGASITDIKGNAAQLALPAPGAAHSLDANTNIEIDTPPTITGSAPFDGAGAVALNNNMVITFSEAMTMAGSAANFRLLRDDGGSSTAVPASVTVSGATVSFDPVSDLEIGKNYYIEIDSNALADSDGNGFGGLSGTSAYNFNTIVDSTLPSATLAQTSNAEGTYKIGDTIAIQVAFDETVMVTGSPRLELNLGAGGKFATHTGVTSGTALNFAYVVQEGDSIGSLNFKDVDDLTGITDLSGNALDAAHITFSSLTAAQPSGYGSEIAIDGVSPTFSGFNAINNTTDVSAASPLTMNFSENIKAVDAGSSAILVSIDGAAATPVLIQSLISGNAMSLPLTANTSYVVTIPAGTVADAIGNPVAAAQSIAFATMASPTTGDTIAPRVQGVTASVGNSATTLNQGGTVTIVVLMSESIQITGSIGLNLQIGSQVVQVYASGYDGNEIYFPYTVAAGQNTDSLQYANSASLFLNDAFIRDMNNNNAVLTLPAPGALDSLDYNTAIKVDTLPTLASASPAAGAWNVALGSNLVFNFSENMTLVGGAADFKLFRVGTPDVELPVVASVSGSVLTLDPVSNLDLTQNYYVQIASGALVDSDLHPFAGFSGSTGFTFNTKVDTTGPVPLSWNVVEDSTDVNHAGAVILTFDEPIFAAGPTSRFIFGLDNGDGTEEVLFSNSSRVTISGNTIAVTGFDNNREYLVSLSNGSLVDAAGNPYSGFPDVHFVTAAVPVSNDSFAPTVLDVSASVGATPTTYAAGETITVKVTMSEAVTVSGSPPFLKLVLDNGTVAAMHTGTSGNVMTFQYVVQPGDNTASLAYLANGLTLPDTGITDANGNNAVLTLATPGAAHSLDFNTDIAINTAPVVTSFSPADNANFVSISSNLVLTFSETIILAGSLSNVVLIRDNLNGSKTPIPATATISGNVLTIDPDADLDLNQFYHVEIANTVLTDATGKPFVGIVGETEYNFNTNLAA